MAIWKKFDGWVYEYFELDEPAENFGHFQSAYELWDSKREGRRLPSWADFDFFDFKGWHGKVNVAEISYDPFDFKFTLFGVDFVDLYKEDFTGKSSKYVERNNKFYDEEMAFLKMTAVEQKIARTAGVMPWNNSYYRKATLVDFPLSSDGEKVTHTLEFLQVHQASADAKSNQ